MVTLNHFDVNRPIKPTEWHVEGLLYKGINTLAGQPGSAKSILAEYVSFATAYEKPCLGLPTRYGPVLYINNDHPVDLHNKWIQRFCEDAMIAYKPTYDLVTIHHQLPNLVKAKMEVERILGQLKPVLMVIDRLSTSLGSDEDSAQNVEPFGELLRDWTNNFDITIILIHHFTKELAHVDLHWMESTFGKRLRGSGAVLGMTDSAMELVTTEVENERLKEFGVRPHPKRAVVLPPFRVGLIESGQGVTLEYRQGWQPVDLKLQQLARLVLPLFDNGEERTVINVYNHFAGAYDIKEIRDVLKYLESKGELKSDRVGKGGKFIYRK